MYQSQIENHPMADVVSLVCISVRGIKKQVVLNIHRHNKKASREGGFWIRSEIALLLVAIVTLGGAAFFLVAVFAGRTVCSIFVDLDLGRLTLVAGFTAKFLTMRLMIESDVTLTVLIGDDVGSIDGSSGKSDQHDGDEQFLHVSLLFVCDKRL
jgi:hypothetical protein